MTISSRARPTDTRRGPTTAAPPRAGGRPPEMTLPIPWTIPHHARLCHKLCITSGTLIGGYGG
eukprot:517941-Hanusia_phi.AAC.3